MPITLSGGKPLACFAASGAFGYDGRPWFHERLLNRLNDLLNPGQSAIDPGEYDYVVSKTVTRHSIRGAPWDPLVRIAIRGSTVFNAWAMRGNPGIDGWLEKYAARVVHPGFLLSIYAAEPARDVKYSIACVLDSGAEIAGIELNGSCPNKTGFVEHRKLAYLGKLVKRRRPSAIVSVKLSADQGWATYPQMKTLGEWVDFVNINSVPRKYWDTDGTKLNPLWYLGGGAVSGQGAQTINWEFAQKLEETFSGTSVKVIWPSVWTWEDIEKLVERRRKGEIQLEGIAFGSIHLVHPAYPTGWIRRI